MQNTGQLFRAVVHRSGIGENMTPENYQRVVQALRNASVLVAAHVDGAEHAFAARQLQLSIALMLNELGSKGRVSERSVRSASRIPPRGESAEMAGVGSRRKQAAEA